MSEEQQGRNLAKAAHDAGTVECFIWSTMPSSHALSGGKFFIRLYEGKSTNLHAVPALSRCN
jgi:hypothetical protein